MVSPHFQHVCEDGAAFKSRDKVFKKKLPDQQRQVVSLRYLQGFSIKETAELIGTTEGAVKMACLRGIKTLHEIMGDEGLGQGGCHTHD